jgi:hypothetical protein
MGKVRERQIILKTDQRNILLEMGREGKFTAKSSGWDESRVFLKDDNEVAVKNGRWMMTHLPAGRCQNRRQSNTTSRPSRWRVTVTAQRQSDVVTLHRHGK